MKGEIQLLIYSRNNIKIHQCLEPQQSMRVKEVIQPMTFILAVLDFPIDQRMISPMHALF